MELKEIEKMVTDFSKAIDLCLRRINYKKTPVYEIKCTIEEKTTEDGEILWPKGFKCNNECENCEYGFKYQTNNIYSMEVQDILRQPLEQMKMLFLSALENGTDKIRYFWDDIERDFETIENKIIGDEEFNDIFLDGHILDGWVEFERAKRWFLEVNRIIKYKELELNYNVEKALKELVEEEQANKTKAADQTPAETPKAAPAAKTKKKKTPVEKPLHFVCNECYDVDKLTAIFDKLKKGGYFDANATLKAWLYIWCCRPQRRF